MALLRTLVITGFLLSSLNPAIAKEGGFFRRMRSICRVVLGGEVGWQTPVRVALPQFAEENIHWFRPLAAPIPEGQLYRQATSGTVYLSSPELLFPDELPAAVRQWIRANQNYVHLSHFADNPGELIVEFRLRGRDEGTLRPGTYCALRLNRAGVEVLANDRLGSPGSPGGMETNYLAEWFQKRVFENDLSFRVVLMGPRNNRDYFFRYNVFHRFVAQLDQTGWIVGP